MMDVFEINKILQAQIKPRQEFKAPVIREFKPVSLSPDLMPENHLDKTIHSQSSFPWKELVIVSGVTIVIIIVIYEIRKRQDCYSFTRRRQDQQSNNNENSKKVLPQ